MSLIGRGVGARNRRHALKEVIDHYLDCTFGEKVLQAHLEEIGIENIQDVVAACLVLRNLLDPTKTPQVQPDEIFVSSSQAEHTDGKDTA